MRNSANTTITESLERRSSHLEALHRVGVALAGSFDIESILRQIANTAGQLVGSVPIDVYYTGSSTINSKPKWRSSVSTDSLSDESRKKLAKEIVRIF